MNKIVFDVVHAQAIEVVAALIHGSIERWVDMRLDCAGHDLSSYWCDFDQKKRRFFQRRLREFSKTLLGVRVTEVSKQHAVYPDGCEQTHSSEATQAVHFLLGDDGDSGHIKIQIAFDKQCDLEGGGLWKDWVLSQGLAILCLKHPQKKYVGKVLLGDFAFERSL